MHKDYLPEKQKNLKQSFSEITPSNLIVQKSKTFVFY